MENLEDLNTNLPAGDLKKENILPNEESASYLNLEEFNPHLASGEVIKNIKDYEAKKEKSLKESAGFFREQTEEKKEVWLEVDLISRELFEIPGEKAAEKCEELMSLIEEEEAYQEFKKLPWQEIAKMGREEFGLLLDVGDRGVINFPVISELYFKINNNFLHLGRNYLDIFMVLSCLAEKDLLNMLRKVLYLMINNRGVETGYFDYYAEKRLERKCPEGRFRNFLEVGTEGTHTTSNAFSDIAKLTGAKREVCNAYLEMKDYKEVAERLRRDCQIEIENQDVIHTSLVFDSGSGIERAAGKYSRDMSIDTEIGCINLLCVFANLTKQGGFGMHMAGKRQIKMMMELEKLGIMERIGFKIYYHADIDSKSYAAYLIILEKISDKEVTPEEYDEVAREYYDYYKKLK